MQSDSSAYPALKFLDEFAEIDESRNRLPHWRQDRAAYFVTYRLHDSVPTVLMDEWRAQRDQWRAEHPRPWSPDTEADYHKRFSSAIDRHLDDGHGSCLLREPAIADIVAGAFPMVIGAITFSTPGSSCRTMCTCWSVPGKAFL